MRGSTYISVLIVTAFCGAFAEMPEKDDDRNNAGEAYTEFADDEDYSNVSFRRPKLFSLRYHPLFPILRQSPAYNYRPVDAGDPFDFLRDIYPLPPGLENGLKEYDYVVVGAGSSGCVLASRLSEDPNVNVLLLEAGGPESFVTDIPVIAALYQTTDYNWGYKMEKMDGICLGMEEGRCHWPKGKGIGGSTLINYMIYTRGRKVDWDRIAANGNPGWSYDDVLPYFKKSEKAKLKGLENSKYHGDDGLLHVEDVPYHTPLLQKFLEAGIELGHKRVDYNKLNKMGFASVQANLINGRRHSVSKAFLRPFKHRKNLHILPKSRVVHIKINKETKTAKSVQYVRNRLQYDVKVRREIILSAGAFASPQLLMLSGIGPKAHLEELGIPVIQDLKVGENMYDHMCYPGLVFLTNTTSDGISEKRDLNPETFLRWLKYGDNILTLPGAVEGLAFLKTNISEETIKHPDLELIFLPGAITSDESQTVRKGMKISNQFFQQVYGDIVEKECWSVFPMLLAPKSKGYMKLKDKNPFHWPKFYYDYFSDRRDLLTLVEGIKYAIKLSETKAFQSVGSKLHDRHFPTCYSYPFGTDEYWECAVRTLGVTLHHQTSTCKMGPSSDPEAVVDHELRVHGIKGLRVADTSIIPKAITAHTSAPAIMIGEKLADILKNTWK